MRKILLLFLIIQFFMLLALYAQNIKSVTSPPTWIPVPNLQSNMSIIGKIQISPGLFSLNENDILGAFVGTECRGVANPFSSLGGILFLTAGSNIQSGETLTFKIYFASTNQIVDALETIPFQNAGEVGTMANPFIFTFIIPCSLSIVPSNLNVTYSPAASTSFAVTTTCNWSSVSNQTWCTATPSGSGSGIITINCSQNTATTQRIANITVTVPGLTPVVVTVTQSGAPGPPVWTPAPNLQFNMNIIGKIQLSPGVFSLNENDKIGAFVGNECRGVTNPFASLGGALFLTIGSNALSGETVTFKIFLSSTNEIVIANETMPFQNAGEIGTMAIPYIFTFPILNNVVVQGITINSGQTECFNALQTLTVAGAGTNFQINNGGTATMIAGQKILFFPGATVKSGGHLHAYITTTNSYCSSTPPSIIYIQGEDEIKISDTCKPSLFIVYPNPTNGKFILKMTGIKLPSLALVKIYNMKGKEVLTKQLAASETSEFSLENHAPGIYLVSVLCEGKIETMKILKY